MLYSSSLHTQLLQDKYKYAVASTKTFIINSADKMKIEIDEWDLGVSLWTGGRHPSLPCVGLPVLRCFIYVSCSVFPCGSGTAGFVKFHQKWWGESPENLGVFWLLDVF